MHLITPCFIDVCSPNPCNNGGTCRGVTGGPPSATYRCDCVTGWTGSTCTTSMKILMWLYSSQVPY